MNLVKSIDKIKSALEQLKDAADKTEVKYPEGTPKSVLELQKKNITKAAEISEQILDEAKALTLFFGVQDEEVPENDEIVEELKKIKAENEALTLALSKLQIEALNNLKDED